MKLKFPKRSKTHLTETESWRVLDSIAPKDWIVREVTERDYGIDAYIELVDKNDEVTGQLMSAQLKGVGSITWKKGNGGQQLAASPQIKTSTAAYWHGLPVPVFLLVADLAAKDIHFVAVKELIRGDFEKLETQGSMTFPLSASLSLKSSDGPKLFRWLYARERLQPEFAFHITNLISQMDTFADFIRMNQNRDSFMEVEAERHLQFRALYESCRMASLYLESEWPLEELIELYRMDRRDWKGDWVLLHEKTLDYALQKLQVLFPALVRKALKLVSETEAGYWMATDRVFFSLCSNGELNMRLKQFEGEIGH
ncbi:DUF4365 domain-containing protein [Aurantiacibacter xanthus]|nr:DUF4365 domain-containing protein [Aurantiacibacter xanthus]